MPQSEIVRRCRRGSGGCCARRGSGSCAGERLRRERLARSIRTPESVHYPFVSLEVRLPETDLEAVRKRYGLRNWSAAVKEAVCRQAIVPMTKEEALAMQGFGWDGDLDEMRDGSPGDVW